MKVSFCTLGCKVNQYESEALAEALAAEGFEVVPFGEPCDATVVNTCAVTTEGERKARQMIRRAQSISPGTYLVVTGCAAQLHPEALEKIEGVSYICGNGQKKSAVDAILAHFRAETPPKAPVNPDSFDLSCFEPMQINKSERTRAYIKIEDGCDAKCTYCIIRQARGTVRSKPMDEVVAEAKGLVEAGYRELVLTGIEIAAYGKDLGCDLADLLMTLSSPEGLARLRLGSLDPAFLRPRFLDRIRAHPTLCHHFHLSLQSGCDKTLAAMKRRNNTAMAKEAVAHIRKIMPDATFTADIIVGFPGETEEDFAATAAFVAELGLLDCHIFAFSPRPGTEAAAMPDQLSSAVKAKREKTLAAIVQQSRASLLSSYIGQTVTVLFEEYKNSLAYGHTANFLEVCAPAKRDLHNTLLSVCLERHDGQKLFGTIVE